MLRATLVVGWLLLTNSTLSAIEYGQPGPVERFGKNGWLIEQGSDHGVAFRSYLVSKQLLIAEGEINYVGVMRVEGRAINPRGVIIWNYKARCAVRPDLAKAIPLGLYYAEQNEVLREEQFSELGESPSNADRGWHVLWWAVCKNTLKRF